MKTNLASILFLLFTTVSYGAEECEIGSAETPAGTSCTTCPAAWGGLPSGNLGDTYTVPGETNRHWKCVRYTCDNGTTLCYWGAVYNTPPW